MPVVAEAMAGLLPRRRKRPRLADSRNGNGQHMVMTGHMQPTMPAMMIPAHPYMNMNPGTVMGMNPGMNMPMMHPCAGMQNMSMATQGSASPAAAMQGNPMMNAQMNMMPGFSQPTVNVLDDDSEQEEEESDTTTALQHPQQQQVIPETPSASGSGNEVPQGPVTVPAHPVQPLPPPPGSYVYNKGEDATITGSTTVLKGLPRTRLVASLEKLYGELEAGRDFPFVLLVFVSAFDNFSNMMRRCYGR